MIKLNKQEIKDAYLICGQYDFILTDLLYSNFKNSQFKIDKKCFNILNNDICEVYVYNNKMIIESTNSKNNIPDYFYKHCEKIVNRSSWNVKELYIGE